MLTCVILILYSMGSCKTCSSRETWLSTEPTVRPPCKLSKLLLAGDADSHVQIPRWTGSGPVVYE